LGSIELLFERIEHRGWESRTTFPDVDQLLDLILDCDRVYVSYAFETVWSRRNDLRIEVHWGKDTICKAQATKHGLAIAKAEVMGYEVYHNTSMSYSVPFGHWGRY
jgi:hypothetical protein